MSINVPGVRKLPGMGRAGRYTLSVMAWVAAFAGWSSIIGLVVAAATGDEPRTVSTGGSTLMYVLGPLVPTLVALWFNDWARDGFPTREQKRAAAEARAASAASGTAPPQTAAEAPREVPVVLQHAVHVQPVHARAVPAPPPARSDLPVVQAHPLGVPAAKEQAATDGRFPVAPLLRD